MPVSEPLPHFVDDLLGYLHETHPTHATLDGVHTHDDLLEDLSRHGIDQEARALAGYLRRLEEIDRDGLTVVEALEHRMLGSHLRGRMFDLEATRNWERNPQVYADVLASSLAGQALFTHAPAPERARRVLSKLRQAPRLIQAARDNVKEPPGIFVKVGIETMRGALKFIDEDLPRAFSSVDDLHLLGDLADAQQEASHAIGAYIEYLEKEVGPKARASFRLGRDRFEQKLRLEEGINIPIERLLTIAERELAATQEAFRQLAGKMNGGDPLTTWAKTKENHPAAGELVTIGRDQLDELIPSSSVTTSSRSPPASRSSWRRRRSSTAGRSPACGRPVRSRASQPAPTTTSRTWILHGRRIVRRSTCGTTTCRRCGRCRSTRSTLGISCTTSTCGK